MRHPEQAPAMDYEAARATASRHATEKDRRVNGSAMDQSVKRNEIPDQVDDLEGSVSRLDTALIGLAQNIEPLLEPVPPSKVPENAVGGRPMPLRTTPLGAKLRGIQSRIDYLTDCVNALHARSGL